ncbi:MAG: hypothetical protein R2766_07230 [Saprospiraceae bacterium]
MVVVGVSEMEGTIYNPKGINVKDLIEFRKKTGSIIGFPGSKELKGKQDWIKIECDILIPAALESTINAENASMVKAKIIGEAANGPVTADAEAILLEKGVIIVPDMFLNAGGVTVSYFEWLKNLSHIRFGRMDKRFNQNTYGNIMSSVEKLTGKSMSTQEKNMITRGADEIDLVRSGLEKPWSTLSIRLLKFIIKRKEFMTIELRHLYVHWIKVAADYLTLGVFP